MSVDTMGTTLFGVAAAVALFIIMVALKWRRNGWTGVKADLLGYGAVSAVTVWLLLLSWSVVVVIDNDHRHFVTEVAALRTENASLRNRVAAAASDAERDSKTQLAAIERENDKLRSELHERTHNLSTQTPAFSNISGLANAFRGWRATIGSSAPCRVEITAPPDARDIALAVGQLSVIGSNCPTFGPSSWDTDPDEETKAKTGMVPKTVVVHIARGVRGDVNLFNDLQSLFVVKRSYEVPAGSPENLVWLQFGPGTVWNTQRE